MRLKSGLISAFAQDVFVTLFQSFDALQNEVNFDRPHRGQSWTPKSIAQYMHGSSQPVTSLDGQNEGYFWSMTGWGGADGYLTRFDRGIGLVKVVFFLKYWQTFVVVCCDDGIAKRAPQFEEFLKMWNSLSNSVTTVDYNERLSAIEEKISPQLAWYLHQTWLSSHKHHFIQAWIKNIPHFSHPVLSRV